jgi:hypothetical protein
VVLRGDAIKMAGRSRWLRKCDNIETNCLPPLGAPALPAGTFWRPPAIPGRAGREAKGGTRRVREAVRRRPLFARSGRSATGSISRSTRWRAYAAPLMEADGTPQSGVIGPLSVNRREQLTVRLTSAKKGRFRRFNPMPVLRDEAKGRFERESRARA